MSPSSPEDSGDLRRRVQAVLDEVLARQERVLDEVSPDCAPLVTSVVRLVAGGKRLRPAFCYWGWRGAGGDGDGEAVVRAAAALELFQAAALIHDDVMDASDVRRGQPAAHRQFAALHLRSGWVGDAERFGAAGAILTGDLCLAWSDEVLGGAGLDAGALRRARRVFDPMRTQLMGASTWTCSPRLAPSWSAPGHWWPPGAPRCRRLAAAAPGSPTTRSPARCGSSASRVRSTRSSTRCSWVLRSPGAALRWWPPTPRSVCRSARPSSCATTSSASSATRSRPASPPVTTCGRASEPCSWPWPCSRPTPRRAARCASCWATPTWTPRASPLRGVLVDTGALDRVEAMIDEGVRRCREALASAPVPAPVRTALDDLVDAATTRAA